MGLLRKLWKSTLQDSNPNESHSRLAAERSELPERAQSLMAAGRVSTAAGLVAGALETTPNDRELLYLYAKIMLAAGRSQEAVDGFLMAEREGIQEPDLAIGLGQAYLQSGNAAMAEERMRMALTTRPTSSQALFGLGMSLYAQRRILEAESVFDSILADDPSHADALARLGNCRLEAADPAGAEAHFRRSLQFRGNNAETWRDLGVALNKQDRYQEALEATSVARHLETLDGGDTSSFVNLAVGLAEEDRYDEAIQLLDENLRDFPIPRGHYTYALALLARGRLEEGWHHLEFRWFEDPLLSLRPASPCPRWNGQDLAGKTVLIRAEQGIGDSIQFLRYAPFLQRLGARVLLKVQDGFEEFAQGFAGIDRVLASGHSTADFDFIVHPLSLPGAFGTSLDSIPASVPYLRADDERVGRWKAILKCGDRLKVGLVWAGSPTHLRDRYRSLPLDAFAPLGRVEGVHIYSLQKGSHEDEAASPPAGMSFTHLGSEIKDFCDTAAIVSQLDLVICVDTSVAHLAGSMGVPVWVLLPRPADWRWLVDRDDTPWYPSMRLFRQRERGNWGPVLANMEEALVARTRAIADDVNSSPQMTDPTPALPLSGHRRGLSAAMECRCGILQYQPDDPSIGAAIANFGEWLRPQLVLLAKLIPIGSVVIEAGSGVGAHSLFLASAVGDQGRLLLSESDPVRRRILQHNLAANRVKNARLLHNRIGGPATAGAPIAESVDELRLASLGWIKVTDASLTIDVIGGAADSLWRMRPGLFAAVSDEAALAALAAQLDGFGYRRWRCETPWFDPSNFAGRSDNIFGERTELSLLAVPEEVTDSAEFDGCTEIL